MVYPHNFEEKTGFSTLRSLIADNCSCPLGRQWCAEMTFSDNFDEVHRRLSRVNELLSIINAGVAIPAAAMHDVTPQLRSLKAEGSYVDAASLYKIKSSLETISALRAFFLAKDAEDGDAPAYPHLAEAFRPMASFPSVVDAIAAAVDRHGEIKDTASPELASIRTALRRVSSSMSGIMRRVIERSAGEGIVSSDTAPALRDGRLVIPVPAGVKRRLQGIIHDESATGKTVFIEPAEVVEANNRLRELAGEEHREIVRILQTVAAQIRPCIPEMLESYALLGLFDFIRAKATLARDLGGQMPVLEREPQIEFYHAVHPVLALSLKAQGREVVPLSLRLDRDRRILVISGPNAGGKSVTLKTVGIIQYMAQCGVLPTLYSNSHVSVFENLLIDIGDEQSIENDLSTYSSHLRNMKEFLRAATPRTLILIDEMGSGTEPVMGGALAQSILARLNELKVMGIVTTHYQNLKTFADSTPGVINGAMLYDRQRMAPLFELSVGSPGSSFALEIARKTGFPQQVIEEAQRLVGEDYVNNDKYMLDIARDRRYWSNKRLSVKEKEHKLDKVLASYDEALAELRARKAAILADARREARELLSGSNAALEKTILEIRRNQADKEKTRQLRRELEEYKQQLADDSADTSLAEIRAPRRHNRRKAPKAAAAEAAPKALEAPLAAGNFVKMEGSAVPGEIISIEGKKAEVAFGQLRTHVPLAKLKRTEARPKATETPHRPLDDGSRQRRLNFRQEIDLRGQTVDEALQAVTYFIDDAHQFAVSQVRILHGTGTGALRQAIRQLLQSIPVVKSFHDEDVRFGGAGITVVNLAGNA